MSKVQFEESSDEGEDEEEAQPEENAMEQDNEEEPGQSVNHFSVRLIAFNSKWDSSVQHRLSFQHIETC